jgi:hypothetical protein
MNNRRYYKRANVQVKFSVLCNLAVLFSLFFTSCKKEDASPQGSTEPPAPSSISADVAIKWAEQTLYTVHFSSFNSPTYSSRSLAYLSIAMYESVVHGDNTHQSLSGQLNGSNFPVPETGKKYHWPLVLNASQYQLLKLLYPLPENSHPYVHGKIDALYDSLKGTETKLVIKEIADRSDSFGKQLADAIFEWSKTDGGHRGFKSNFDPTFPFPTGDSYWVPPTRGQVISQYPLHPHWGNNRTFIAANKTLSVPSITPFSTHPDSEYYKMYKAVYDKNKSLTQDEMEIAAWWVDDPTESSAPGGHSYHLATVAIKKSGANLMKAAETYARTGIAVADAFIHCWKIKYTYFNERPSSYVKKYIDPAWIQFWPEPPFPAFPSGHSTQSAASSTVLTAIYGDGFAFTDEIYVGKRRYDDIAFLGLRFPARSFTSFKQASDECAYSRFLGGIHTESDNEVGKAEGIKVGQNVNALQWTR